MAKPPAPRKKKKLVRGAPGWMVTLADMFMLLLTFFVLMLSFSTLDQEKYRAMVASMIEAFNVGSAAMPDPSGLAELDEEVPLVLEDVPIPLEGAPAAPEEGERVLEDEVSPEPPRPDVHPGVEQLAQMLISEMEQAVSEETLEVGFDKRRVLLRFDDEATFPTARAELIPEVLPVVQDIVGIIARCEGEVVVSGHTDDRPIVSDRFRSNWDLSAARAVSLVHELVLNRAIPAENVVAAGHAETRPIDTNTTAEGRARNRRVEIAIYEPECQGDAIPDPLEIDLDDQPELSQ